MTKSSIEYGTSVVNQLGVSVISFSERSEIDVATAPLLREELHSILDEPDCAGVVVDLSNLIFLDSTALGVFVGGLKKGRERGSEVYLDITNADPRILKILEITGIVNIFDLVDTKAND